MDQQPAAYLLHVRASLRRFAIKERGYRGTDGLRPLVLRDGIGVAAKESAPITFRPTAAWLTNRASPELFTSRRMGLTDPVREGLDLLRDVLPVSNTLNPETVRQHLHVTATRVELLGVSSRTEGAEEDWDAQPCPDGPMTVGIDGGMLRARGSASKSRQERRRIPARRRRAMCRPPGACLRETYDTKPGGACGN